MSDRDFKCLIVKNCDRDFSDVDWNDLVLDWSDDSSESQDYEYDEAEEFEMKNITATVTAEEKENKEQKEEEGFQVLSRGDVAALMSGHISEFSNISEVSYFEALYDKEMFLKIVYELIDKK